MHFSSQSMKLIYIIQEIFLVPQIVLIIQGEQAFMGSMCARVEEQIQFTLGNVNLHVLRKLSDSQLQKLLKNFIDFQVDKRMMKVYGDILKKMKISRENYDKEKPLSDLEGHRKYVEDLSFNIMKMMTQYKNFLEFHENVKNKVENLKKDLPKTQKLIQNQINRFDKKKGKKIDKKIQISDKSHIENEHFVEKNEDMKKQDPIKPVQNENSDKKLRESISQIENDLRKSFRKLQDYYENSENNEVLEEHNKSFFQSRFKEINEKLEFQKKYYEKTVDSLLSEKNQLNDKVEDLTENLKNKQQELFQKNQQIHELEMQKKNLEVKKKMMLEFSESGIQKFQDETIDGLKIGKNKQKKSMSQNLEKEQQNQYFLTLQIFPLSEVLFWKDRQKSLLYRKIIKKMFQEEKKAIIQTEKVFSYSHTYQNNLFNSINEYSANLFLLVKLFNGIVIGGYSRESFLSESIENEAFIFSIKENGQFYKFKKKKAITKPSVSIDKNFLVFGSNEIRIKCNKNQGYANINGTASIYEDIENNINFEQFIGDHDRSFEIAMYEVFQLEFREIQ